MDLKKKNLDPIKGNPFAALSLDSLNQIAKDVSISIGMDEDENHRLIDNLVKSDREQYENFVNENPETLLPENLDNEIVYLDGPLEGQPASVAENTPDVSLKENDTAKL
jgi:hypothetical protein